MNSVYQINKGINKPIEFKGLKAQYIAYLAIGLVVLLLAFAIMYLLGVHMYLCLILVGSAGTVLYNWVTRASRKYGKYGLMKRTAARRVPACLKSRSRKLFWSLNNTYDGTK